MINQQDNTVGSRSDSVGFDPVTTPSRKGRNDMVLTDHYTQTSLRGADRNIPEYITGYVDGEGCFTVTFNEKSKALLGWEFRPSFSVSQNEDRRQVLDLIKEYFGCGFIRRDWSDKTVKFEVRDHRNLMKRIIPHFEKFPLISAKHNDFILFKTICGIVDSQRHLNKDGFIEIINLAYQMNGSGKRKRTKSEIINSLCKDKDIV
jgi:hypothetical protein